MEYFRQLATTNFRGIVISGYVDASWVNAHGTDYSRPGFRSEPFLQCLKDRIFIPMHHHCLNSNIKPSTILSALSHPRKSSINTSLHSDGAMILTAIDPIRARNALPLNPEVGQFCEPAQLRPEVSARFVHHDALQQLHGRGAGSDVWVEETEGEVEEPGVAFRRHSQQLADVLVRVNARGKSDVDGGRVTLAQLDGS